MDGVGLGRIAEPGKPEMVACQCLPVPETDDRQTNITVSCPHGRVQTENRFIPHLANHYAHYLAVDHQQNKITAHRLHTFNLQVSEETVELHLKGDHVNKTYRWRFGTNGMLDISAVDLAVAGYAALHILERACDDCERLKVIHYNEGKVKCPCLECGCNVEFGTVHTPISKDATDFIANTHPGGQNTGVRNKHQYFTAWKTWLADRENDTKELYGNTISTRWEGPKVVLVEMDKVTVTRAEHRVTREDGKWQIKVHGRPYSAQPLVKPHSSWEGGIATSLLPRRMHGDYSHMGGVRSPTRLWNVSSERVEKGTDQPYAAVSYVWSEYTDAKLRQVLAETAAQIGIMYFWVDRWCIRQSDEAEKAREIPMMGNYYSHAVATVILVDTIDRKVRGEVDSYYKAMDRNQLNDLRALADDIAKSSWVKRVWTFQEGWVGRNPIIRTKYQWIDAELVEMSIWATGSIPTDNHYLLTPGAISLAGGTVSGGGNIETGNGLSLNRTWFAAGSAMPTGCRMKKMANLSEAMYSARGRQATIEEDHIYGLLAATQDGEKIEVKYGIGIATVLDEQLKMSRLDTSMLSATTRRQDGSWQPCFKNGIPAMELISGAKMQWHSGGGVYIAANLVQVDERTMTDLKNNQQSTASDRLRVPPGTYLMVIGDKPEEITSALFLTGSELSDFNFYQDKEGASRIVVPLAIRLQMKAYEKRWTVR